MDVTTFSAMALWTAATLYTIALVASSVRLARVAEARTAARTPVPAMSGAPATAEATGEAVAGDEAPAAPNDLPAGAVVETAPERSKALGIGRAAMFVGAGLQLAGVVTRGIDAGHAPFANMYEFTIAGSLVAVLVFLFVQRTRDLTYIAPGVAFFAVFAIVTALRMFYRDAVGLQPALDSYWLVIHVPIATIASGIFAVSGIASGVQLMRDARDRGKKWAQSALLRPLAAAPEPAKLEALAFRFNAVGFVLWTFTIMSGAMWAEHAWGRFWGWDPKEVWSFVIWVIYAAYLHARTTQGWAGRRAAWLAISGLVAIILNFTVVNLYVQGLHSYSGLSNG